MKIKIPRKLRRFHMKEPPSDNSETSKWYSRRFTLFSKYDDGCVLDEESWYSVTREELADHIAERIFSCFSGDAVTVVDAFGGVGGNAIAFAKHPKCAKVLYCEVDPLRVKMAKNNARVYEVLDKILFYEGDFFEIAPFLKGDVCFLAPPWGGPEYINADTYDLKGIPGNGFRVFSLGRTISKNVAMFLPRNLTGKQIRRLLPLSDVLEIEESLVAHQFPSSKTVYCGSLVKKQS